MFLSQSKEKKFLPINKVTRLCVEREMSDMVFLEPHLTDEVVPENFMDPPEQNNFQDRHKIVIPIERKPFQREMVHSRTIIYLQPLRKIPERFSVHLERLPKGTTCFLMEKLPLKTIWHIKHYYHFRCIQRIPKIEKSRLLLFFIGLVFNLKLVISTKFIGPITLDFAINI